MQHFALIKSKKGFDVGFGSIDPVLTFAINLTMKIGRKFMKKNFLP